MTLLKKIVNVFRPGPDLSAADKFGDNQVRLLKSGAGLLVALVVILIFLLAATFLKSLFFGFLLAYLFLPLEKFIERICFRNLLTRKINGLISRVSRKVSPDSNSDSVIRKKRERLTMHASVLTVALLCLTLLAVLVVTGLIVIPQAAAAGQKINVWAKDNEFIQHTEVVFRDLIPDAQKTGIPETGTPEAPQETAPLLNKTNIRYLVGYIRAQGKAYITDNTADVLKMLFTNGRGLVSGIFSTAGTIGSFLFDLVLCLFFFVFFLQKLALFTLSHHPDDAGRNKQKNAGAWVVKSLFESDWLPEVRESTRKDAEEIINHISAMFNAWVRGYFSIIAVETLLFSTIFALFGVPHFVLLGLLAGGTILLPFLGWILSLSATVCVCLILLNSTHLVVALIGVGLAFLLITGLLEQLLFYPKLVGGAIGLNTLETIIVVLLGALFGGITGMIFAVPVAAVLKYLIPKIYRVWFPPVSKP